MFVRVNNAEKRTNFDYLLEKTAKVIDLKMQISEKGHKTSLNLQSLFLGEQLLVDENSLSGYKI